MEYTLSKKGIELIKEFECFKPEPYLCPAGFLTIGYGHKLSKAEIDFYKITKHVLLEEDAVDLLKKDLQISERAVNQLIQEMLNQHEFDALVSFTFNAGKDALEKSTLRHLINNGQHEEAPRQFIRWVYATDPETSFKKKLEGLVTRRKREANVYALANYTCPIDPSIFKK